MPAVAALARDGGSTTEGAGNSIYQVRVDQGGNLGAYSATTGPGHPSGPAVPLLSEVGNPASSFTTVHSYTSGRNYTQIPAGSGIPLAPFGTVTPLGTTGFRTTYAITGADRLEVVQDVEVRGATEADSAVVVSTTVRNTGAQRTMIGLRHLWDLDRYFDGAPAPFGLDGQLVSFERSFTPPLSETWTTFGANPTVTGTVNGGGPSGRGDPASRRPDSLRYVSRPDAARTPFRYDIPDPPALLDEGTDSAVLYYWGADSATAIDLAPGQGASTTVAIHAVPDGETPVTTTPRPPPFEPPPSTLPGAPRNPPLPSGPPATGGGPIDGSGDASSSSGAAPADRGSSANTGPAGGRDPDDPGGDDPGGDDGELAGGELAGGGLAGDELAGGQDDDLTSMPGVVVPAVLVTLLALVGIGALITRRHGEP